MEHELKQHSQDGKTQSPFRNSILHTTQGCFNTTTFDDVVAEKVS